MAARVVAAVVSAALLAGSGWGWYLGQVADASLNRTDAIPTSGNDGIGSDINLLLVGQDGRSDLTPEQLAELHAGQNDSGGLNTDTMIPVHIPADGSRASNHSSNGRMASPLAAVGTWPLPGRWKSCT